MQGASGSIQSARSLGHWDLGGQTRRRHCGEGRIYPLDPIEPVRTGGNLRGLRDLRLPGRSENPIERSHRILWPDIFIAIITAGDEAAVGIEDKQ